MKKVILGAFALVLVGCNSTDSSQAENTAQSKSSDGTVCRQERKIGSNMRITVCRTKAQREEERKEAELAKRTLTRKAGGTLNSSGRATSR